MVIHDLDDLGVPPFHILYENVCWMPCTLEETLPLSEPVAPAPSAAEALDTMLLSHVNSQWNSRKRLHSSWFLKISLNKVQNWLVAEKAVQRCCAGSVSSTRSTCATAASNPEIRQTLWANKRLWVKTIGSPKKTMVELDWSSWIEENDPRIAIRLQYTIYISIWLLF